MGNLVCALGFCVQQCTSSKDCSNNELCIKSDNGNACRAPEVAAGCVMNSDCTKFCNSTGDGASADDSGSATDGGAGGVCPIICGRDRSCRTECVTDVDCPGGNLPDGTKGKQKCTTSGACIDPVVDVAIYDPKTNDFKTSVSGTAGTSGTAGGGAGATGTAGSGTDGGAGTTGTAGGDAAAGTGAAGTSSDGGGSNTDAETVDTTTVTPNKSVRQGGSATITIAKSQGGLSNASIVSFGALDKSRAVVQTTSTDMSLVIKANVPHGAPLGMQTLVVSTTGGVITLANVIEVTAITAGPTGNDANAGSPAAPLRSVKQAILFADAGDTVHLMDGTYSSSPAAMGGSDETWSYTIPNNITVTGDSIAGTILDGSGMPGTDGFDAQAMLSLSNMTLKHFRYGVNVTQPTSMISLQHIGISTCTSYAINVDAAALGSTISLSGSDSLIDQPSGFTAILVAGNSNSTNQKITINITDATVSAGSYGINLSYTSGTTLNVTGATLKMVGGNALIYVYQNNNVIGNSVTIKTSTLTGSISMSDKNATLTMTGGTMTQKSSYLLDLNAGGTFNISGTKMTMSDNSNAINFAAPNGAMTLTNVTITGGGACVAQTGAGSTAKLRGTEMLSPQYYAYYLSAGNLDLGTAADAGGNGLGLPVSTSYYALYVPSTSSTVTSSSTSFGDHLDGQGNLIQGKTPGTSMAPIPGPTTLASQLYSIAAGSQITFF